MVRSRIDSSTLPLYIDIALGHSPGVREYCTGILALVAKNMRRVECLHLDVAPVYREIIHQTFKAAPAPLLRRFVVKYTACLYRGCSYCERPAAIVMPTVFGGHAPRLTDLQLHNVFFDRKHPYPAFHNVRHLLLFAGTAECVPIELVRRLCPRLEALDIRGRYCVVGHDPIGTYTTRRRPSHELNVILGSMSEASQATALAEIIAVRSKIVSITNPSPLASRTLYHHFSDASNISMAVLITSCSGRHQMHLLFKDPSSLRMRVLVADFARTEYERQSRVIQNILGEMQGLKKRISFLRIDYDQDIAPNMFKLLNGWEGQWSACEAICLTFGNPSISSSITFGIGLDAATFPVLKLLVICCYHPDSPEVKVDTERLDILTTSLRELLSDEGTKNFAMVYTRDLQVALDCARSPVKTLSTSSGESWTWL
ncbi:hypothetical protein EXIGLDRAFT_722397 [Exidia glandulosa HHB12029]|uniref:Uncharacterized protein n=1 Tax=Exidia glandulosa HHB12029 TaxID=1314781 RepID=A0A165FBV7_EXIGL|nr:hypothetical protein EXIGLDRAFT_722397 [Exidia glandulosa HHB12029]